MRAAIQNRACVSGLLREMEVMIIDNCEKGGRESDRRGSWTHTIPWPIVALPPPHSLHVLWLDSVTAPWLTLQCEMNKSRLPTPPHPTQGAPRRTCTLTRMVFLFGSKTAYVYDLLSLTFKTCLCSMSQCSCVRFRVNLYTSVRVCVFA